MPKQKSKEILKKTILLSVLLLTGIVGYWMYVNIVKSNVHLDGKKFTYIYIKNNATFDDVLDELYSQNIIDDKKSFEWTAKEMGLTQHVNAGRYRIDAKMSNRSVVKMIINNKEEKVKLHLNYQIRTKEQFIEYVCDKLEIEPSELENYCSNEEVMNGTQGLNSTNFTAFIVPATYETSWATTTEQLFTLLKNTFTTTWPTQKITKAKTMGYTVPELVTLASIVQSESAIKTEQQKIAGVYINRLKQDMKLQADPTVVFANGNFEAQRILNIDKDIDSPYNTYMYKGLPPGPICLVNSSTIDAVLNYTKHNYIFFCAKPDFSGYSSFTSNYQSHQQNARAYQAALTKKGIKR